MAPEKFFDLEADPYEIENLVNSTKPAYQAALKRLRAEMDKWLTESSLIISDH